MNINFYKYHGTGNDFVMIDNRNKTLNRNQHQLFAQMCHRRFGIGADGVILLQNHQRVDFEMVYFNADGKESSMCGNGGRCIVAFAHYLGVISKSKTQFSAIDGLHEADIKGNIVSLKMSDVTHVKVEDNCYVLNTGSPHYVSFVDDIAQVDVDKDGRAIRNGEAFKKEGINVNFVKKNGNHLHVLTYERGVEAETYSCGTGVVASSIAAVYNQKLTGEQMLDISTKGGSLAVKLEKYKDGFHNIWLKGPTQLVFAGEYAYTNEKKVV